jgi:hypothetical protein
MGQNRAAGGISSIPKGNLFQIPALGFPITI